MMNSSELLKHISTDRKAPDVSSIPDIENLLQKYPASSLLHMLYAKVVRSQDNQENNTALQLASLYCNDRKKLFNYLHDIPSEIVVQQHIPEYRLELQETETKDKPGEGNDLISKFLNEKPIFQMRREMDPEEEEPQAEPEIISEAMAEIYARQGKTEKAISTFEKLSLKYPEKSTYFAARIEKIKKN